MSLEDPGYIPTQTWMYFFTSLSCLRNLIDSLEQKAESINSPNYKFIMSGSYKFAAYSIAGHKIMDQNIMVNFTSGDWITFAFNVYLCVFVYARV
jgi:hypothetical protein